MTPRLPGRRGGGLCAALVLLATQGVLASPLEYQVKAEFIERFTRFIDWPEGSLGLPEEPFVLCLAGGNPFDDALTRLARSKRIKDRPVEVRALAGVEGVEACHALFVGREAGGMLEQLIAQTKGRPVLVIGDTPDFERSGVLINFFLEGGRVRFTINREAARASGLQFSARLLELARVVDM